MEIFVVIFLLELVAVALTVFCCRLALRYNRQAGWYLAPLGAIGASVLFVLVTDGDFLFHPDRWEPSKTSFVIIFRGFLLWFGITIIPSSIVVRQYRKKGSQNGKHVA